MRKIVYIISIIIIGLSQPGFGQQVPIDKASGSTTSSSPGVVFAWSQWASQNFLFDNEYLNQYGFGFHDYNDGNNVGGINAYFSSHFGLDFFTGSQRRMRINLNGNVGIGGGVPSTKLDVGNFTNGSLSNQVVLRLRNTISQNNASGWGSAIEFFNQSNNVEASSSQNEGGAKIISQASDYGWSHNLIFRVVQNNNYTNQIGLDALVINTNGSVGMGTTLASNPNSYKLAVKGKIGAQEVQVENTSSTWGDYVFEKDYQLKSLSEVEAFVNENKHLPEVPSKKEVEENGHKLGEMDVILLKKVEELTLYLIEANKQIEHLNKEVQALKNK